MKKSLLFILMILLLPISAKAASMEISCTSSSITVGGTVRCTVTAKEKQVGGGAGVVKITNGTVTASEKKVCAIGDTYFEEKDGSRTLNCADVLQPNSAQLAVYTLKGTSAGTMTFTIANAIVIDESFNEISVGNISKSITVKANTTQSTTKSTTKPTTKPTQNPVPNTQAPNVTNPTEAPHTEVPQTEAPNTEPITEPPVEEPTEPTTEEVVRPTPRTSDTPELKSLKIKNVEFSFNPSNYTYNITVKNNIKELDISYERANDDQVVAVSNTELKKGLNKIFVEVTEGENKTTYTLNVTQEEGTSLTKIAKIVFSTAGLVGLSYALIMVLKRQ